MKTLILDGSTAQYENESYTIMCFPKEDFNIEAEWYFSATAHGKGPCDGVGGTVKRLAVRRSLQRPYESQIMTPIQLYQWAEKNIPFVNFLFVTQDEYSDTEKFLANRLSKSITIHFSYAEGILFLTSVLCVSSNRVKRYTGNRNSNEWNWNRREQLTDIQTKGSSQPNWPSRGNDGSIKGRGDANPNRDGSWGPDNWSSGENRNDGYDMGWSNPQPQGNSKGSAYPDQDGDQGGDLETILRGVPGMDFPNFLSVPKTEFDCSLMPSQGYYGDVEAGCQVFHICQPGNRKDSFLCPIGTIFNQKYFVCDWWFNVNCNDTPSYYDLNNDIYKEVTPVTTEAVPVTTEKTLPWNPQDLDRKKTTKSWGNQPTTGKQNPGWTDTPIRRGSKPESVPVNREVSNSWSRSDVQQKEVAVSWGSSIGTPIGGFGSSSTSSNAFVPTTKPIWYGIDGQPAKDQSDGMTKRTGLVQTSLPFGTRMRSRVTLGKANTWAPTEVYDQTTLPMNINNVDASATRGWLKGDATFNPAPTTRGWPSPVDISIGGVQNTNQNHDNNYDDPTQNPWSKGEDIPETSINPTGIKGVWEQKTTRRSDDEDGVAVNAVAHKGFVRKSDNSNLNVRKSQTSSNHRNDWGHRQTPRGTHSSTTTNRGWGKNSYEKQKLHENSNINAISRRKNW